MKSREDLAEEYANNNLRETLECPRHIKNPGKWFGFMRGFDAGVESEMQDYIEACKTIDNLKEGLQAESEKLKIARETLVCIIESFEQCDWDCANCGHDLKMEDLDIVMFAREALRKIGEMK